MPKIFSVEVLVCATAYIIAETEAEAAELAAAAFPKYGDASVGKRTSFGEVEVSEYVFDGDLVNEDLPTISLSPALTFVGSAPNSTINLPFTADLFEEVYDPEDEAETPLAPPPPWLRFSGMTAPTWDTPDVKAWRDRTGGILIRHADGTEAYLQPGDDTADLAATLDRCGDNTDNVATLLCDFLPD